MNFFLLKILKFVGSFSLIAILLFGLELYFVDKVGIKINESRNILILGDSHTECAIDDRILNRAANFSESGSTYFFSLMKLRQILRSNKQIDTLLLSFHFGSLDKDNEKEYLFNDTFNIDRLPKYLAFFSLKDIIEYYNKPLLIKAFLKSPLHYFPFLYGGLIYGDFQTAKMGLGKFSGTKRNKLLEDIENRKGNDGFKLKEESSNIELKFLYRIKKICFNEHVKLILVNSPVFQAEKYTDVSFYYSFCSKNKGKFTFWDYSRFNPGKNGFADISHLNQYGARLFSNFLKSNLGKDASIKSKDVN